MRIVFGILNWGLGHATRSECLIRSFVAAGHEVLIWTDGAALDYLSSVFPQLECIESKLPVVHYRHRPLWWGLMLQAPGLLVSTFEEQKRFARFCKERSIEAVVSDNRPGLAFSGVPSAYISHQIQIPLGGWAGFAANRAHHKAMKGFDLIAIPDAQGESSGGRLSGQLSARPQHASFEPIWLGHLSRFARSGRSSTPRDTLPLVVLSGPEPARSQWEAMLVKAMQSMNDRRFRLVRGCEGRPDFGAHIEVYERLDGEQLLDLLERSAVLICRSGYSSLLDALWTGIPLHCVPTPGQAEQEYLAEFLERDYGIPRSRQREFDLRSVLSSQNWKAFEPDIAEFPEPERLLLGALEGKRKG